MRRLFAVLRGLLVAYGYSEAELAEHLGRSLNYVSQRLMARAPWMQNEQYAIMDLFGVPYELLYIVFPKDGMATDSVGDLRKLIGLKQAM